MSRSTQSMTFQWTYKEALVIKHALRDKPNKDVLENAVYLDVCEEIERFREKYGIVPKVRDEHATETGVHANGQHQAVSE